MIAAMIERARHAAAVNLLLSRNPVVALLGARQVGKSTLARQISSLWKSGSVFFDLENPDHLARLAEPMLALGKARGLVVIDEVQRRPDLFPVLRVLTDRLRSKVKFLVLGSASRDLLQQSSESLAGRIAYHEIGGFTVGEVTPMRLDRLWHRGGFPRSFLARSNSESTDWRRGFIQTFLERDLPQLGIGTPTPVMRRFWTMLAHYHGQIWNSSEFARSFGVSDKTVRRYLDDLTQSLVVFQLSPWYENLGKRVVKSPKIYFRDSGLFHAFLNITTPEGLESHPRSGASWEGFALTEVMAQLGVRTEECSFWRTHAGAELDLLVVRGERRWGFEFKRSTAPKVTPSMRSAMNDLQLKRLDVIHAGQETFHLTEGIRAVSLSRLVDDVESLAE